MSQVKILCLTNAVSVVDCPAAKRCLETYWNGQHKISAKLRCERCDLVYLIDLVDTGKPREVRPGVVLVKHYRVTRFCGHAEDHSISTTVAVLDRLVATECQECQECQS